MILRVYRNLTSISSSPILRRYCNTPLATLQRNGYKIFTF